MELKITLPFDPAVKLDEENLKIFTEGDQKIIKVEKKKFLCYNFYIIYISNLGVFCLWRLILQD